jgi:HEAT repeats
MRAIVGAFATVAAAFSFGFATPRASAEETSGPTAEVDGLVRLAELEGSVAQHKKDRDEGALARDLDGIAAMYKAPDCPPERRKRLSVLVGVVLQAPAADGLVKSALRAIAEIGDEANWKYVRKYLQQPDPKSTPPLLLEAIEAAGKIKASSAVDPLLKLVDDSKTFAVAAAAIRALGAYGDDKRARVRILDSIVKSVRRSVPGGRGMKKGGQSQTDPEQGGATNATGGDASRWGTLAPAFVEAANKLTGKSATSAEDWFDIYDRYKGKVGELFEK